MVLCCLAGELTGTLSWSPGRGTEEAGLMGEQYTVSCIHRGRGCTIWDDDM